MVKRKTGNGHCPPETGFKRMAEPLQEDGQGLLHLVHLSPRSPNMYPQGPQQQSMGREDLKSIQGVMPAPLGVYWKWVKQRLKLNSKSSD